jgi:signal peptidase II
MRPGLRTAWLAYGLALIVIALDQAVKLWVIGGLRLETGESLPVVWPLSFTLVWNDGISFGFFQTHAPWTRWALAAFSLAASAALVAWAWRMEKRLAAVAVGLILGGAVGNLVDRIRLGAVVDFVDVHPLMFPWIFNIADSGITVGVVLLVAETLLANPRSVAA